MHIHILQFANKKNICILLLFFILFASGCQAESKEVSTSESNLPKTDEISALIPSQNSILFNYKCEIWVNRIKSDDGNIPLSYMITISLKDRKQTVKDVVAICKLNPSVKDIIYIPTRTQFGNEFGDSTTLNENNHALVLDLVTLIDQSLNLNEVQLEKILKEPLKVSVSWEGSQEFVEIAREDITLHIEKKK